MFNLYISYAALFMCVLILCSMGLMAFITNKDTHTHTQEDPDPGLGECSKMAQGPEDANVWDPLPL